jgi:hypothetical protein
MYSVGVSFSGSMQSMLPMKNSEGPVEAGNQVSQTKFIFRRKRCSRNPDRVF